MVDVYVYYAKLPPGINEMVAPCCDGGYTIYIDLALEDERQREAYQHAVEHIRRADWDRCDVQEIEADAHGGGGAWSY